MHGIADLAKLTAVRQRRTLALKRREELKLFNVKLKNVSFGLQFASYFTHFVFSTILNKHCCENYPVSSL